MNDTPNFKTRTKAQIEAALGVLPMLSRVVVELSGLDPSSDQFAESVRALAESDPPFALRILAAANSAASAPIQDIMSIPEAVNRLGALRVANLVTSLGVMRVFVPSSNGQKNLWRHSIQVAVAAREIATASKEDITPSRAYLIGLLHDIGRFVMFEHDPVDLEAVDAREWKTPAELLATEEELCGFNHADLGAMACRTWGLPNEVSTAIAAHHRPAKVEPPQLDHAVRAVQLADRISCEMLQNAEFERLSHEAQRDVIAGFCEATDGNTVPIDAKALLNLMPTIQKASTAQIAALGL